MAGLIEEKVSEWLSAVVLWAAWYFVVEGLEVVEVSEVVVGGRFVFEEPVAVVEVSESVVPEKIAGMMVYFVVVEADFAGMTAFE